MSQPIAFFNSNSDEGLSFLCFGKGFTFQLSDAVDFDLIQHFIDEHKGNFMVAYVAYDLKNNIEQLSSENNDGLNFPTVFIYVPECVAQLEEYEVNFIQGEDSFEHRMFVTEFFKQMSVSNQLPTVQFHPRTSKSDYIQNVNALKEHIQRGDIYEINYCQEYFAENVALSNPVALYSMMNEVTQAPFSVYLQHDEFTVMCGSPERFIQKVGSKLSSQPIKGTAPRSKNTIEDENLKDQLRKSQKEQSENVMIVDLVRNDLSKIAKKGSVNVDELFGIYSFNTVHQMISTISCEVEEDINLTEILKATFPMGSMTGAPKIRALQLSEQYESFKRGLYSGTIGYILPNGDFDFNVVIRSLLYNSKKMYLSCAVGGAITINSDAESEYRECETKVGKLLSLFNH